MKPYTLPVNYEEIKRLGDEISNNIFERKIPKPEDISKVLGESAVMPYYFMHALFHYIEHGRNRSILDYGRRDQFALQRHSYDSAIKPYFRLNDKNLPSNYLLTPREIRGILVHDLGEEFGKSLLGALITNYLISNVLGEQIGKDADILTNKSALLLDSLEGRISKDKPEEVYDILKESDSRIFVKPNTVMAHYQKSLNALERFRGFIQAKVDYMDNVQQRELIKIIDNLSDKVKGIKRQNTLSPDYLTEFVKQQHSNIMGIIEDGKYIEVDENLLLPDDPKFLLTLKKTLYRNFIEGIAQRVREEYALSFQDGTRQDDGYLGAFIEKVAESTHTVATMDNKLRNATSIFRKARTSIAIGIELVNELKQQGMNYERLQRAIEYLHGNVKDVVNQYADDMKTSIMRDTNWNQYLEKFRIMKEKTRDLGDRVEAMNGPSWVREKIRDIGSFFGVKEIKLGRVHFML